MLTKRQTSLRSQVPKEVLIEKMLPINRNSSEIPVRDPGLAAKPTVFPKDPPALEMQPTFSLTFTLGTRMRDLHDTIIRTVLQHTRGNRLRAAQFLQINPRTIRRRLGKKESVGTITRAA